MIEYQHINLRFGHRDILKDVSVALRPQKVMLLSGDNGSGKSSLLRIMAGLIKPDSGQIISAGEQRGYHQCRADLLNQVMYLHQTPYLFEGTVKQNLRVANKKGRHDGLGILDQALEWVGLSHLANENASTLSGGERQRIALARAMIRRPRILLLDEPTAHLDALSAAQIADLLNGLKSQTVSMMIASHEPRHLQNLVDGEYRLDNGRVFTTKASNTPQPVNAQLRPVIND